MSPSWLFLHLLLAIAWKSDLPFVKLLRAAIMFRSWYIQGLCVMTILQFLRPGMSGIGVHVGGGGGGSLVNLLLFAAL